MDDDDAMLSQLPGADLREEVDSRRAIVAGRIDILFRLGRHYLFLPFAALCVAATLMRPGDHAISDHSIWVASTPLLLQILLTIAAERLAHLGVAGMVAYAVKSLTDEYRHQGCQGGVADRPNRHRHEQIPVMQGVRENPAHRSAPVSLQPLG